MAAIFHMLHHHHPRFFRKRSSSSSSSSSSAPDCGPSHFQSTCINKLPASVKRRRPVDHSGAGKNDHHMETAHGKAIVKKRSSEIRERSPEVTHKGATTTCDFSVVEAMAPYCHKVSSKQYYKRQSASILDSSKATNYTIREPPRKLFQEALSPDQCCSSPPASADRSRSLPAAGCDGRSQFVAKSLFNDKHSEGQEAPSRCHISHINEETTDNKACKDPLEQLKESLRALAELQQTTQQIVDGFEVQKYADKASKKTSASSLPWWNARKVRSSNNRHASVQTSTLEGPALQARISSFDYTEAIRISQKIDDTPARLSLDGRELVPKVVLKLREAMRLGIVNRDQPKCSAIDDQKKRIDRTSLRSGLLAPKEEIGIVKGISSNSAKSVAADRGGQHSNVIARLMGLHDFPMSRDGSMESKRPQPRLLKDLENTIKTDRPHAEHCSSAKHKSDCTTGALEPVYGSEGPSKLIKQEAFVHEDGRAQALQRDPLLIEREVVEGIGEMQFPIVPRAGSHSPCCIKDKGPAFNILPRHAKMEAMPTHLLIYTRAGDRSGRAKAALDCAQEYSHDSEKIILQERFKDKQEHVKGLRDVEFEIGRRQVKTSSSRLQHNTDVELSMEVKGLLHPQIQENLGSGLQTGEISDEKLSHFHQSKNASKRYDQSMVTQSQLESKLLEGSKVMQPQIISISPSVDDHPQVPRADPNNKADAASRTSSSPKRKSHYRSDKRINLGEHDKIKGPGTKHQLQRRKGVKLVEDGDQTPTIVTKPASPTATSRMMTRDIEKASCLRKHHPAEAAPIKGCTAAVSDHMRVLINQVAAACEEYEVRGRSIRKTRSLDITKNAGRKISKMCAEESATAKTGAGSKMKRNEDYKSHKDVGLGGSTVSMRSTSVAQRAGAGTILELVDAQQLIPRWTSCPAAISKQADSTKSDDISVDAAAPAHDHHGHRLKAEALPASSKTATILDAIARPQRPRHHADHDNAEVAGQLEYVEAILERAGLLGDDELRVGAWVTSHSAALATFLEMERSCTTLAFGSRHQRRLILDCVYHILVVKTAGGGCKRAGLLLDVWNELKCQMAAAHLSTSNSNDQRVRLLIKRDMDALEQSQEACWTCRSPSLSNYHLTYSLEGAIFQDLLQDLIT